jgi:hypothetical protein
MSDFTFTDADGKSHTLPPIAIGQVKMTGRDLRDASVGGETGQLGYMFKVLEAAGPSKAALDALYSMPQAETLDVLEAWGDHGDGDGASLGESSGSSI